jgi:4-hydroxy-tetrahydrodipicolinate synthase
MEDAALIKTIPNGVYPTMITPFTQDNKIDYNAVEQMLQWYADRDVDGIFAICQSSEIFFLSVEEKLELLKFIVANVPKGITIIASGHTADDLDTQIYEANQYIQVGIDAYVFISNRFAKEEESDSIFLNNIEKAINAIDEVGLGIYECPYPYKRVMMPDTLGKLAATGKFQFLKDTCGDLALIGRKLDAVKGTGLKIYNAHAGTLLETLKLGCSGYSGVMANFHPEIYGWLCKNFENEPEKAQIFQNFVGFASMTEWQMYPVNAKYYLGLEGIQMGYTSRARDASLFIQARKMEIDQMRGVTLRFKAEMNV